MIDNKNFKKTELTRKTRGEAMGLRLGERMYKDQVQDRGPEGGKCAADVELEGEPPQTGSHIDLKNATMT